MKKNRAKSISMGIELEPYSMASGKTGKGLNSEEIVSLFYRFGKEKAHVALS